MGKGLWGVGRGEEREESGCVRESDGRKEDE